MNDQERGEAAWKVHKKILENEEERRLLLAHNAHLLNVMYEEDYHKVILGDNEAQWSGYLGQVDIFYSRNEIECLITCEKRLTQKLGIAREVWIEAPLTRLMECMPLITQDNYTDWLIKACTLTQRDWRIETREAKGLETEETHKDHTFNIYEICTKCGKKHKITRQELTQDHGIEQQAGGTQEEKRQVQAEARGTKTKSLGTRKTKDTKSEARRKTIQRSNKK